MDSLRNTKAVFLLYLAKKNENVIRNKNKTIYNENKDVSMWGLKKNRNNISIWKKIKRGDLLFIYDAEKKAKEEPYIYFSDSIVSKYEDEDRSENEWNSREFPLIFEFNKPQLVDINNEQVYRKLDAIIAGIKGYKPTLIDITIDITNDIANINEMLSTSIGNDYFKSNTNTEVILVELLLKFKQIVLYGPPGTGKTHLAKNIARSLTDPESIKLIQFHPSYTYEDFARGIEVKTINGQPVYETKNKIFAQICEIAKANPDKKFVLIIDEINRANLPAILGELIYALEYRGEPVETPYEINGDRTLIVPENLYIIGTMNTADRSVGHIDYAIRRRFIFYPVRANKYMIENEKARELYEKVIESIFKEDNMSPEFRDKVEDVKIGHTYFLGDTEEVAYKFVYQVIPLLIEYIRDGILKNEEVVGEAFKDYFGSEGENWKELDIETVKQKLQ